MDFDSPVHRGLWERIVRGALEPRPITMRGVTSQTNEKTSITACSLTLLKNMTAYVYFIQELLEFLRQRSRLDKRSPGIFYSDNTIRMI